MKKQIDKFKKASTKELQKKLTLNYSVQEKTVIQEILKSRNVEVKEIVSNKRTFKMLTLEEKKEIKQAYLDNEGSYRGLEKKFNLKPSNGNMVMKIVKNEYEA